MKIQEDQIIGELVAQDYRTATVFKKYDIDFYLVGAVARDLWMSAINDIPPSRITGDIDFAVFIDDKGTYDNLKKYLIEKETKNLSAK